jgi:serine/threonine-protein kinase RsbW
LTVVELRLSLCLPRDAASVPVARRILGGALNAVGVSEDCRSDIQLALTEACANVVVHARAADTYQVAIVLGSEHCQIEVIDDGSGFDPADVPPASAPSDESGRGLHIIRSIADRFDLSRREPAGLVLRFMKRLSWDASGALLEPGKPAHPV